MLNLSTDQLELLFPFHFTIDEKSEILSVGKSLRKIIGHMNGPELVSRLRSDNEVVDFTLETLKKRQNERLWLLLVIGEDHLRFTGTFLVDESNYRLTFLGVPLQNEYGKLIKFGIVDSDLGVADSLPYSPGHLILEREERTEIDEFPKYLNSYHEQLIDTSTRLNTLLESLNSAVLSENRERKIVFVNQLFCDMFGLPNHPDTYKGMDCSEASEFAKVLFEDPEGFVNGINACLRESRIITGERLQLKDGRTLERDFIPVFEKGVYAGQTWKYTDITQYLINQQDILKKEDKYSKIIENLKFGLIEVDLEENITKVYPAFCELTGYKEEELLGQNAPKLFALEDDLEYSDELNLKRREGISTVYERRIRKKDGSIIYIIISGAPIYNEKNEVVGSMGIHVDITERKLLENELFTAKEAALSSVKAKELFLANMSHEIRTPMNVIVGMTDLIGESVLSEEQTTYVNAIKASAQNLLVIINDILDFSKIESGHVELEEIPINLISIFEQLEFGLRNQAIKKGIELNCSLDPNISSSLQSDPTKIYQVLVNLVSNAIKFTEKGGVELRAELLADGDKQQRIVFRIIDSGIGIDPKNIDTIFKTFVQEDAGISRKYGGTGLGLSIAQGIVRKMGGDIHVSSVRGEGSEFSFELTLEKVTEISSATEQQEKSSLNLENVRILVAEDNELNILLITSILSKENIPHEIAKNGEEVLQKLQQSSFDVILMDVQMPVMDGITATGKIRTELKSAIPIIALSANATTDDTKRYIASGMNAHVPKPYKKDVLLKTIADTLGMTVKQQVEDEQNVSGEQLFSMEELRKLAGGDESFVKTIIHTFLQIVPVQLKTLELNLAESNLTGIRDISHQMKPTLQLLKVHEAKELVLEIEQESSSSEVLTDQLLEKCRKLDSILKNVMTEMQVLLNQ
jgi:PAS domain S-box-containing protein